MCKLRLIRFRPVPSHFGSVSGRCAVRALASALAEPSHPWFVNIPPFLSVSFSGHIISYVINGRYSI